MTQTQTKGWTLRSIETWGGRLKVTDNEKGRFRDIEIWGRDSRYGDVEGRLKHIETWEGD